LRKTLENALWISYLFFVKKNKRKWKSLTLKVEHLRLELEDAKEVMEDAEREFMEELSKVAEASPPPPQPKVTPKVITVNEGPDIDPPPPPAETVQEKQDLPEEIKSLWKQIAKATHPDKTGNDPEKTELYKRASAAAENGAIDEIIAVAMDLGLDVPEASPVAVMRLEQLADDLAGRLKNLENSVLLQWASAPPNKRATIMALYMKSKGMKPKKAPTSV